MDKQFFLNLSAQFMQHANDCYKQSNLASHDEISKKFLVTLNKKFKLLSRQTLNFTLKS